MEVVKNKQTRLFGRIVFLVCIALLMAMCQFAGAQILRQKSFNYTYNIEVISRFPDYGIELNNGNDSIYLSFRSDSINTKAISAAIYAYFPKNINLNGIDLIIHFENGILATFNQNFHDEDNYVEFRVNKETYPILKNLKFKYFEFKGLGKYSDYSKGDYFTSFIKSIKG